MSKINWKEEIDCGSIELFFRRKFTAIFYTKFYRKLHPQEPWLTPGAMKMIKKYLTNSSKIFEYGSGLSTVWFSKKCDSITSVEHDEEWFKRIKEKIKNNNSNAQIIYVNVINENYSEYEKKICEYENESFDIILIDGRSRVNCMKNSIDKIKKGGLIILDDSQRPRYQEAYKLLSNFKCYNFNFGFKRTTVWSMNKL